MLAVVDDAADVHHRIPGDGAGAQHLAHALFDRGDELPWNRSALDLVDELEPAAARHRLDAQEHLAELAGAAGLLLVAVMALGVGGDRLAVGDARRPRVDVELVDLAQALQQHAQMQLAEAVDDGLVGVRHMLDLQARVFIDQLLQDLPHALVVAAALGLDRQPVHGDGEVQRLQVDMVILSGIVQHRIEVDLVDLGHRADVARLAALHLDMVLALQHEQVPHLEGLAAIADVELAVFGDGALVDAEDAHLADVRVDRDLEHMRDHVLGRVGVGVHRLRVGALALQEFRRVAFARMRQQLDHHVEQLGHAGPAARGDEAHRDQMALAQRLLQRGMQLAGIDVAIVEVAVDEGRIDFDHLLDQRAVRRIDRAEVGMALAVVEAVHHLAAATIGQVQRQALLAESLADLFQQTG